MQKNPFEIFEIPVSYIIDSKMLHSKFIASQIKYHPDSTFGDANTSLNITISYNTLRDDIKRGDAILAVYSVDQNSLILPHDFFEDILLKTEQMLLMDISDAEKLLQETHDELTEFKSINEDNIERFAVNFIRYKYIHRAFTNTHDTQ
jgi:hypothetical protein